MNRIEIAPTPDYAIEAMSVTPTVRHCCDCGELCMVLDDAVRCDPCQSTHLDELETAKRVLKERLRGVTVDFLSRSGGMNDPREILCDECGEVAITYTGNVDSLDRTLTHGECGCYGRIDVDQDDEGNVRARFLGVS